MMTRLNVFPVLVFVFVSTLGIFPGHAHSQALTNDRILKFGVHVSAMGKLDPHFAAASQDRALADMVFNGLLRYEPGNAPKIEPDLARKIPEFDIIGGKQVWTVFLRKGVMFHAGPLTPAYELTADDVVFSLNKSKDKRFCAYAGAYTGMTAEKIDPYTVRISLEKPISPTLFFPKIANYGGGFIVSKQAIDVMGYDGFSHHPIGTGPFSFQMYDKGNVLNLSANDQYFRGRPLLDGVQFYFIPDITDREDAFEKGNLDVIIGSLQKGWLDSIKNKKDIIVDNHGVGEVATLHFNTRMKPLDDIRVRKAIALSINRKDFLSITNPRFAGSVYSPVPEQFLPGGLSLADVRILHLEYPQDLDAARQLLKEAGYPNGFALDLVSSEKRVYRAYYETLKKQLAKVNITCHIKIVTHSAMHRQIRQDPKPLVIYAAWRPNADAYLTRFFHSDSIVLTGKKPDTNFSQYTKIDKLIEAARLEINPVEQINLWEQAQIRILNDMAAFPLMYTKQIYLRKKYVDYGHILISTMALYPQFTEKTALKKR